MPCPLPVPPHPPRVPSPSPPSSSQPPLSSSLVPLPHSAIAISVYTSQFTSKAVLSTPPTDPSLPLPPSSFPSPSCSSAIARAPPLLSTMPMSTPQQIHQDSQAFAFPLPPSPVLFAPALLPDLSERPSEKPSSRLDHPAPGDMDAWAAALPPIPPSPVPKQLNVRNSWIQAQMKQPLLTPTLVPSSPLPQAASVTPPVAMVSYLDGVGVGTSHAPQDDSFVLLDMSMNISGAASRSTASTSGLWSDCTESSGRTNGDRTLLDLFSASESMSAPEQTTEALSSSWSLPSLASTDLAPSSTAATLASPARTPTSVGIPVGRLGVLTAQTHPVAVMVAPALAVIESPPASSSSGPGVRCAELVNVVEEREGDLSENRNKSRAGSITLAPSLGTGTTVGVGGTTPTSATTTTATATNVFGTEPNADGEVTSEDTSESADNTANPLHWHAPLVQARSPLSPSLVPLPPATPPVAMESYWGSVGVHSGRTAHTRDIHKSFWLCEAGMNLSLAATRHMTRSCPFNHPY